ncbi:MAG TPA: YjbE family putative metal transport protein [Ktedonobacterales bacterium]|nr:YjbE family putative metal transport protein [Ktedonobacterales bacterium]
MLLQWLGIVVAIIVVDITLSGDNALVIGSVASKLPVRQRRQVIVLGGLMAVVLRIALAGVAAFALRVEYLQALGGLVVFVIAVQMAAEVDSVRDDAEAPRRRRQLTGAEGLLRASFVILLADVSMSLDNVLAVAALARGNYALLALGIAFSMMLLLVASAVVARLMARFPRLLYIAAIILAWTSGTMVADDHAIRPWLDGLDNQVPGPSLVLLTPLAFVLLLWLCWLALHEWHQWRHRHTARHG